MSSLLPDWGEGSESIDFFLRRFKGEKKGMKIHLRKKSGPIPRHEMKLCFLKLHSLKLKTSLASLGFSLPCVTIEYHCNYSASKFELALFDFYSNLYGSSRITCASVLVSAG